MKKETKEKGRGREDRNAIPELVVAILHHSNCQMVKLNALGQTVKFNARPPSS